MENENIQDIYELSPLQEGILFHCTYAPELSSLYLIQMALSLRGKLNVHAFHRAWQEVVNRHTSLRTSFYWEDIEKPVQIVYKQVTVPLKQHDWRGREPVEKRKRLEAFLEEDRKQGFDLSQDFLIRLNLFHFSESYYEFVFSAHFIIADGWSLALIFQEVGQLYQAFCQGRDISFAASSSFGDYIAWLQKQDLSKAEVFWRQKLKGLKSTTSLTNLYADNLSSQKETVAHQLTYLSKDSTARLQVFARRHKLTLFTLLQGVWALLLSDYTDEQKVVYGCTVAGRPVDLKGADSMIGMLINSLPVWVEIDQEQYLLPWLKQLQEQLVEMRQYEYSPLVKIQGWSEVPRDRSLFESLVVFEKVTNNESLPEWEDIELELHSNFYWTNYPLNIVFYPSSKLGIEIAYYSHRFDKETIIGILEHLEVLLQNIVANPEVRLKDLSLFNAIHSNISSDLEKEVCFDFSLCN
ncbi:MAG TPA: non-ribosomal peptide synthetase [Cyanobacteria bacterium UBA11370]|nr:non-ribosomal peptide synthetase [Cyanobacteria bacterium UBA11370]HBY77650.1 non-ribosomal peptide synthetase [Cyanobacteria bacterium UBA11148]